MKRKFLFDHIYKAAGSSVGQLFIDRMGVANVTPGLVEPLGNALARYADRALVTGHFSLRPGERLPRDRYTLTLLRDPVDRLVSHYYFARNHVEVRGANPASDAAKRLSLEDYVVCDVPEVRALMSNDQTLHFMPMKWDGTRTLSADEQLAAAKAALDEYDLVGTFDEFDDFVEVLCCDAGWPPVAEIPRANATRGRLRVDEIPRSVRARLEALNALDLELCAHARALFRSKRRATLRAFATAGAENGEGASAAARFADPLDDLVADSEVPPLEFGNRRIEIVGVAVTGQVSRSYQVSAGEIVSLQLTIRAHQPTADLVAGFRIVDDAGRIVYGTNSRAQGRLIDVRAPGDYVVEFRLRCDVGYGDYAISASVHAAGAGANQVYHWRDQAAWLGVIANVGDHWEGAMKMYPQVSCAPLQPFAGHQPPALVAAPGWQSVQHLAFHAPELTVFSAVVEPKGEVPTLAAGEVVALEVQLTNAGQQTWPAAGLQRVCFSYRWLDRNDAIVVYDGERTPLVGNVAPGETVRLWAVVKAPHEAGDFVLSLTLLQEYVAWFDERGSAPARLRVRVTDKQLAAIGS